MQALFLSTNLGGHMTPPTLPMDIDQARIIVLGEKNRGLGRPLKMPWYAFGLSASACKRGQVLAQNLATVCAQCYGLNDFYKTYHNVKTAHELRMKGLTHKMWVPAMVTLLLFHARKGKSKQPRFFRWFDSGDLQDGLLEKIVAVCTETPAIIHWLPTHEPHMVLDYLNRASKGTAAPIPKNLVLRISADYIGKPPEQIAGLEHLPTHTVHRGHGTGTAVQVSNNSRDSFECPSFRSAKKYGDAGCCGKCRKCWDPKQKNVSFPIHREKTQLYQLKLQF
jgi:hypothetical protein